MTNILWTLAAALLVYFMHAGFGFFEAGMCRHKNTVDTLSHNLIILAITLLIYWLVGFGLMYGDGNGFIGLSGFAPDLLPPGSTYGALEHAAVPIAVAFAFAMSFADTPATLIAGSGAERIRFCAVIALATLISGVLFPTVGHWNAGGGWFTRLATPVYDTGSGMIHLCGGSCALAVAWLLGPRQGVVRQARGEPAFEVSSMPMVFLGAFILWLGFLGFNAGYAMKLSQGTALVILNTVIAGGSGALAAMTGSWLLAHKAQLRTTVVGLLTANVVITSSTAIVEPGIAAIIGALAGFATPFSVRMWAWLCIDDPTEYLTMNLVGGMLGILCVGIFASPAVIGFYGVQSPLQPGLVHGGFRQIGSQIIAAAAIVAFSFTVCAAGCLVLRALDLFRVPPDEEREGADQATHGESAGNGS